ncbi:MAG: integrase [Robiginitomaculum sp.]|nr:MAG: integrase [Robiginitomaculum sp.]
MEPCKMKIAMTQTLIEKAKAKSKPYEIRDVRLIGLLVRVQPTGKKTYYCEYRRGARIKIGQFQAFSVKEARNRAKEILADYYQGGDPALILRQKRTASTYLDFLEKHYFPWMMANYTSGEKSKKAMLASCSKFMNMPLTKIVPYTVEKWRTGKIQNGNTSTTANRHFAVLRASLTKAVEWGFLPEHPLRNMKLLKTDKNLIVRYFSDDEEKRIRAELEKREAHIRAKRKSANEWRRIRRYPLYHDLEDYVFADYLKPMVLLSMNTGMRQGEVFKLKWSNVHFDLNQVTIEGSNAKSGKTRHIPLNKEALSIMHDWRKQCPSRAKHVFTNEYGQQFDNIRKSWKSLLIAAQINDFRWHDLRHHFASKLAMKGANLNTIRELLGHSTYDMTLRYAHLSAGHKAEAVELLC